MSILGLLPFSLTSRCTGSFFGFIVFALPFSPELLALLEFKVCLLLQILSLDFLLCCVIVSQERQTLEVTKA
jgi:hypothetical protein